MPVLVCGLSLLDIFEVFDVKGFTSYDVCVNMLDVKGLALYCVYLLCVFAVLDMPNVCVFGIVAYVFYVKGCAGKALRCLMCLMWIGVA